MEIDYENKRRAKQELDEALKKFLEEGGKIEVLPPCMTSEEYKKMKKKGKDNA